jgi:hypothetical protein
MCIIFYDPCTQLHKLFISSLICELNKIKYEFEIINSIQINYENFNLEHDIIIIFLNPQFLKTHKDIYNEFINISKKFKYKIYYITEPLDYLIDRKVFEDCIKILKPYKILTYTNENINKLNIHQNIIKLTHKFNNHIDICEYDISKLMDRNKDKIIFLGNLNLYREDFFKKMENKVIIKNNIWSIDEYQQILENNLFFINIHRRNGSKCLEYLRIVPLLANGCIVLSELSNEEDMNELKNYNIYFCEKNELLNTYNYLIQNINYEDVYNKVIKFRNEFIYNDDIYNKIIKK